MARTLGQLRCGRCAERFWPGPAESVVPAVICPACGAAHANAESVPFDWGDFNAYLSYMGPVYPQALAWMRRWWADEPPRYGRHGGLWWSNLDRVTPGESHGFPFCVLNGNDNMRTAVRSSPIIGSRPVTVCLLAAWLPAAARSVPPPPGFRFARGGLWAAAPRSIAPAEAVRQLVAYARSVGAEPLFALAEVDDPTPMERPPIADVLTDSTADSRLESQAHRCSICGAPGSVSDLVGEGRCPWCGAAQALPPELAHALALYQRRVQAAQIRGTGPTFGA